MKLRYELRDTLRGGRGERRTSLADAKKLEARAISEGGNSPGRFIVWDRLENRKV